MSVSATAQPPWLDARAASLLDEFALSQAAQLARDGAYDRAESMLRPAVERADAPVAALDLQARLCAQQGRLAEAACWWQKLLEKEPGNPAAQAGLARLRSMQRQPVWLQTLWPLLVCLLVLSGGAGLLSWQTRQHHAALAGLQERITAAVIARSQTAGQEAQAILGEVRALSRQEQQQQADLQALARSLEQLGATASNQFFSLRPAFEQEIASAKDRFVQQLAAFQAHSRDQAAQSASAVQALSNQMAAWRQAADRQQDLHAQLDQSRRATDKLQAEHQALAADYQRLLAGAKEAASPPELAFAVPGVRAAVSGRALVLSFEEGLFDHGTHFRPDAKARLRALAEALSRAPQPVHIQIVGHADDDRPFLKWTASWEARLALARAPAVAGLFLEGGWFLPEQLAVSSGGRPAEAGAVVWPGSRRRHRTVTLRLSRRAAPDVRDAVRPADSQPEPESKAPTP